MQQFDKNGDGFISEEELIDVLCNMGGSPMQEDVVSVFFFQLDSSNLLCLSTPN